MEPSAIAGASKLLDIFMRPENLLLMFAVWAFIGTAKKALPDIAASAVFARIAPVLPLALCVAAMWMPGVQQASLGVGEKVLLGCVLGFAVGHLHKLTKQTFLGNDERIG